MKRIKRYIKFTGDTVSKILRCANGHEDCIEKMPKFNTGGPIPSGIKIDMSAWLEGSLGEPWRPGEIEYSGEVFRILYGSGRAVRRKMEENKNESGSKYLKNIIINHGTTVYKSITYCQVDVYAVLEAFDVKCPAVAHALKKLLCPGTRGSKSVLRDLTEAKDAIIRAFEMENARIDLSEAAKLDDGPDPRP
jgi:hypothetical protein